MTGATMQTDSLVMLGNTWKYSCNGSWGGRSTSTATKVIPGYKVVKERAGIDKHMEGPD